jgi:dihydropteroate synthase
MKTINLKGNLINLRKPLVMGILNITNDSFYDGGKYLNNIQLTERIKEIISEGADIIDIGAYSSRPFAAEISVEEEKKRLAIALEIIRNNFPESIISVDTFRSEIACFTIENFKIDIINDIYAGKEDEKMFETIAKFQVPYIMMHMQGTPQSMQINPTYNNVVLDIIKFFSEKINKATLLGINDIIIDPGFGFGKTIEQNYEILKKLSDFKIIEYPILVGISRKSMIYKKLGITAQESLPSTIALNSIAIQKGASILRVHDVAEAVQITNLLYDIEL